MAGDRGDPGCEGELRLTTDVSACAACFSLAGERVPVHSGAHLFEGHPQKDGAWWDHWELRKKGLETFGDEFDRDAEKRFGYRPRDRWGLEPRKVRPNYGDPERQLKDIEARKIPNKVLQNVRILEKKTNKTPDMAEIPNISAKDSEHRGESEQDSEQDSEQAQENPNICPGCLEPLPVSSTKPKKYHDDACRMKAKRKVKGA